MLLLNIKPKQKDCVKCLNLCSTLSQILQIHTRKEELKNTEHDKSFDSKHKPTLKQSQRGKKLQQCQKHKKCFKIYSNLSIHKGAHTEEKPYKCTECSKSLLHLSQLKEHNNIQVENNLTNVQKVVSALLSHQMLKDITEPMLKRNLQIYWLWKILHLQLRN